MAIAKVSIHSCLGLDINQFEHIQQNGHISAYELAADLASVTLYWTGLGPLEMKRVTITVYRKFESEVCQEKASEAYLYYNDDVRTWI